MSADVPLMLDMARDTAQATVTALLHGDRELAQEIASGYPDAFVLALVLADLVAYTHDRWSRAIGADTAGRNDSWAALLQDIEEWRAGEWS